MKLLPLLLIITLAGRGQTARDTVPAKASSRPWFASGGGGDATMTGTAPIYDTIRSDKIRYDTIPVIMLVSDTATHMNIGLGRIVWDSAKSAEIKKHKNFGFCCVVYDTSYYTTSRVEQIHGYEVTDKWSNSTTLDLRPGPHIAYLDEKKRPLKLFVWQTVKTH
jgi:hypothetical protein